LKPNAATGQQRPCSARRDHAGQASPFVTATFPAVPKKVPSPNGLPKTAARSPPARGSRIADTFAVEKGILAECSTATARRTRRARSPRKFESMYNRVFPRKGHGYNADFWDDTNF